MTAAPRWILMLRKSRTEAAWLAVGSSNTNKIGSLPPPSTHITSQISSRPRRLHWCWSYAHPRHIMCALASLHFARSAAYGVLYQDAPCHLCMHTLLARWTTVIRFWPEYPKISYASSVRHECRRTSRVFGAGVRSRRCSANYIGWG